jgi:putative redox protein
MSVSAVHQDGLRFSVSAREHVLTTDYPLQAGVAGAGMKPLEMLLCSLSTCAGGALIVLLRKAKHAVSGLRVSARGIRQDQHPTVFTDIALEFEVSGTDLRQEDMIRTLQQAEAICPVWAMLKGNVRIESTIRVAG